MVVGDPAFFPALLTQISSSNLPVDSVILQSVLLCLIARNKHLILRTYEEDVPLVAKLAALILSSIFQIPAIHKLRIKSKNSHSDATHFLRSLFLPTNVVPLHDDRKKRSSRSLHPRKHAVHYMSGYTRSISYPNEQAPNAKTFTVSDPFKAPSFMNGKTKSPSFVHSHSDPTPLHQDIGALELPNALVISGLENAGFVSQKAFARALSERKIVLDGLSDIESTERPPATGIWPLPDEFFIIYVCAVDSQERPPIHKTLLDHFAMSATVSIQPNIRTRANALFYPPPYHPSSSSSQSQPSTPQIVPLSLPSDILPSPFPGENESNYTSSQPTISPPLLQTLRAAYRRAYFPAHLLLYTSDLFSAASHHPQLEGCLLTARARKDAEDLAKACRVLGVDLTGMELVESLVSPDSRSSSSFEADQGLDVSLVNDALGDIISGHVSIDDVLKLREEEADTVPILDVSETDVARIVPRVISHRLRVREGPHCEVLGSSVFAATHVPREEDGLQTRSTVKDILVDILSEV